MAGKVVCQGCTLMRDLHSHPFAYLDVSVCLGQSSSNLIVNLHRTREMGCDAAPTSPLTDAGKKVRL